VLWPPEAVSASDDAVDGDDEGDCEVQPRYNGVLAPVDLAELTRVQ
jgi:hypothetical protein